MKNADKQPEKQQGYWLKEYSWKPGQSGNPKGRPKGKTLKEWAKEFLMALPDDKKLEFLREITPDVVWRMAEGNPHQTEDITSGGKPFQPPIYGGLSRHSIKSKTIPANKENKSN